MATNLTPERLARLRKQDAATYNKMIGEALLDGGRYYQPQYVGGGGGGEGGFDNPGTLGGYVGYDESWADGGKHVGEKGQFYNPDGTFSNDYDWKDDEATKNLMMFLAAVGGMAFLPGGAMSSTFGQGTMAAQAGLEGAGSGFGAMGATEPIASLGMTEAVGPGMAGWGADLGMEGLAGATPSSGMGATLPGGASSWVPAAANSGGGLLNSITNMLPSGASSLLGPAATLLGGAAGASGKGGGKGGETVRMDPRLDDAVFGTKGIVPRAQGLLEQQMSPERMAEWAKMRSVGQNLINQPNAGNGFSRFYG